MPADGACAGVSRSPPGALLRPANAPEPAGLDEVFGALSDPIRRAILARLTQGPCSVSELAAPFPVSAPAISKHLAVLERSGLIERRKSGRVRFCRLIAEPMRQAGLWIEQYQAFWERQLDALADYLDREEEECRPAFHPSTPPSGFAAVSGLRPKRSSGRGRDRKR